MRFIRFQQASSKITLPAPSKIEPVNMTKSDQHHLGTGEPSTANNTKAFIKYKFQWKDGIHAVHMQPFIDLMLFENRQFDYYPDSSSELSIIAWVVGKLDFDFVYGGNLNCVDAKLEFYTNA